MKRELKPGNMLYPLPAVLVSCGDGNGVQNLLTIAWAGTVCSEPPMLSVSIRKDRFSHHLIEGSGEFVVNLVSERIAKAADWCGVRSGRDHDKWKASGLTPAKTPNLEKAPAVAESPVWIECRVRQILELGSHDMFLAEIVAVHIDEDYVDENGAYDFGRMGLVAFNHGKYYKLRRDELGFFGFSVMKPKTAKRRRKQGK